MRERIQYVQPPIGPSSHVHGATSSREVFDKCARSTVVTENRSFEVCQMAIPWPMTRRSGAPSESRAYHTTALLSYVKRTDHGVAFRVSRIWSEV